MEPLVKIKPLKQRCTPRGIEYQIPQGEVQPTYCCQCAHWNPPHVDNHGECRIYTEADRDVLGLLMVTCDQGINVGGICVVDHNRGYDGDRWVHRGAYDYCSKARGLDGKTPEENWGYVKREQLDT